MTEKTRISFIKRFEDLHRQINEAKQELEIAVVSNNETMSKKALEELYTSILPFAEELNREDKNHLLCDMDYYIIYVYRHIMLAMEKNFSVDNLCKILLYFLDNSMNAISVLKLKHIFLTCAEQSNYAHVFSDCAIHAAEILKIIDVKDML